jgi:hypothetical protein
MLLAPLGRPWRRGRYDAKPKDGTMRVSLATIVTAIASLWGTVGGHPYVWVPYSGLVASLTETWSRPWVGSDRLGEAQTLSALLKLVLMLIGVYSICAMLACFGLALYWLGRR